MVRHGTARTAGSARVRRRPAVRALADKKPNWLALYELTARSREQGVKALGRAGQRPEDKPYRPRLAGWSGGSNGADSEEGRRPAARRR